MKLKVVILVLITISLINCDNEEGMEQDMTTANFSSRIKFETFEDFIKNSEEISLSDEEELTYLSLFNEDGEIQIGNKIVWIKEGNLYDFDLDLDINEKENLKLDYKELLPIGSIEIGKVNNITKSSLSFGETFETVMNVNQIGDSHQKEFRGYKYRERL
ncbi:hypothetical protein UJ101_00138 [Flavobacteriaceae bacterium UJ101]|nr:hypothetical protein UJ101_00138 [Flavobacteriaceae bacterium UJ101]